MVVQTGNIAGQTKANTENQNCGTSEGMIVKKDDEMMSCLAWELVPIEDMMTKCALGHQIEDCLRNLVGPSEDDI